MRIRRTAAGFILLGLTIALVSCTAPTPDADPTGSAPTEAPTTDCPAGTSDDDGLCLADTDEAAASAEVVHSLFESESLGSVIIGIWREGEPVLVGALGESLTGVPATVDMHHRTGNVGHGIITTLLLQQVEAGVLSLEDPVTKYFPELPLADVTLDMMAHSTSGIAHYTVIPEFQETFYENPFAHLTPEQLIAFGVDLGPQYEPGTNWNFSDTNIVLLGRVLEEATGKTVAELAREGIFEPLGMDGTTSYETAALVEPVLHSYTGERGVWEEATFWDPSWTSFAGGWGSNQDDLRAWIEALGTGALVTADHHERQLAPTSVGLGTNTDERYYAMGISIVNDWLLTAPGLQGYHASVGYLRDAKLTVIIYFTPTPEYDPALRSTLLFEPLSAILAPENAVDLG